MLLAARDQENAVLQAPTQNGKQQKLQGFPKTPGLKKLHQGDENLGTIKKGKAVFASSAFVTPAGPRNRVVLGGKDTNFKTRRKSPEDGGVLLKKPAATPGPAKQSLKQASVTDATPATKQSDDDDYPEIEYMPPTPIDLPELPNDLTPVNVDIIRKNMYKGIFRDQFDEYARIATQGLHSTEDEDRMFAESEADARRVLMREERRDTIRATRGKKAGTKKSAAAAAAADKENNILGSGTLKPKNALANTTRTITTASVGNKVKQVPLQGKTYSMGTISSLHRRLPSRPGSAQASKAATMLSQQAASTTVTKPRAQSTVVHNRAASSAGILSKVAGAMPGYSAASRPKSVASTRPKVDPRVAEMNSKTSIGFSAGRPLAASVQRALSKGMDDFDFSSSEEEDIDDREDVKDNFDDLFMAHGIDINRIDEADEDFELQL